MRTLQPELPQKTLFQNIYTNNDHGFAITSKKDNISVLVIKKPIFGFILPKKKHVMILEGVYTYLGNNTIEVQQLELQGEDHRVQFEESELQVEHIQV